MKQNVVFVFTFVPQNITNKGKSGLAFKVLNQLKWLNLL